MGDLKEILEKNKLWAAELNLKDPEYFSRMAQGQDPEFLWIGCSDSRVGPYISTGLGLGELFVHRNIANLVKLEDPNCMSVIQYAVEVLKVRFIVVCGHYGCGGVQTALEKGGNEPVKSWLHEVRELIDQKERELGRITSPEERARAVVEWNVARQVKNIAQSEIMTKAWKQGKKIRVQGWVYDIATGLIKDLRVEEPQTRSPKETG